MKTLVNLNPKLFLTAQKKTGNVLDCSLKHSLIACGDVGAKRNNS